MPERGLHQVNRRAAVERVAGMGCGASRAGKLCARPGFAGRGIDDPADLVGPELDGGADVKGQVGASHPRRRRGRERAPHQAGSYPRKKWVFDPDTGDGLSCVQIL